MLNSGMKKAQWQKEYTINSTFNNTINSAIKRQDISGWNTPAFRLLNRKGSMAADIVLTSFILIVLILPLLSFVFEKYIMVNALNEISDSIDMSCISAYQAIRFQDASRGNIYIDSEDLRVEFMRYISYNLSPNLGEFELKELDFVSGSFPCTCSLGNTLTRPSVHAVVSIRIKAGIFDSAILGNDGVRILNVHRDVDIPVDK